MASLINRNWVFGRHARLDFSTSVPTASASTVISTLEGCASISDANGTLILYTDGMQVWDGMNTPRAAGLAGNGSSTQSAIIVPNPGNAAQYYIFTADGVSGTNHHVGGIRIDTGTWASTPLSALMTMPPTAGLSPTEKITAIQHANCRDFWVVTIVQKGAIAVASAAGTFRVFLVNSSGVQHVGDTPMNIAINDIGYLKASGDGKKIAIANWNDKNVMVCPFDTSTAAIDLPNLVTIAVPALVPANTSHARSAYGVEFSPNGNILYYSVLGASSGTAASANGYVFQYDLLTNSSFQAGLHPNVGGSGYGLGALQLGMDGRIYIAQPGEIFLGVIAHPDVLGAGCGLVFGSLGNGLALATNSVCNLGLPNLLPNACECACEDGNCDEAVDEANRVLDDRANHKFSTIWANGQTLPTTCQPAFTQATLAPVFSIRWGDGASDRLEDEDTETIYIRIYNPFRNLTFKGVKIFNIRVVPNQVLPNGEDALQLIPSQVACFDKVEPCSHVSRDFAFLIKNAIPQAYQIRFDYCIDEIVIEGFNDGSAVFRIDVVAS
ncbi:MAG: hypothetical protein JWR80_171 [Bradyrhizobium sp.]|nr:hypothetical protein [Bradyrhizobium sp.]